MNPDETPRPDMPTGVPREGLDYTEKELEKMHRDWMHGIGDER